LIRFITDRRVKSDGILEPDILEGYDTEQLRIETLEGEELVAVSPRRPWTHDDLTNMLPALEYILGDRLQAGVNAYLGEQWVGSTEV